MTRNHFIDFFKTLSYREFLTAISLATFIICLQNIRHFYWEDYSSTNTPGFNSLILTLTIIANHFIYKLEHKRFNVFYVRLFVDIVFLLIYSLLRNYLFTEVTLSLSGIIIALIYILIIESLFSTVKISLKYIK